MDGDMVEPGPEDLSDTEAAPAASGAAGAGDGDTGGEDAADALEHDIASLLAERDQFKDIAVRLQADFENYRRRQAAQQADEVDRATGRLVEELLPVLDACELAYAHGADGVEPIWSALIGALRRQGLDALDLQGKVFDPTVAEAVMHEQGNGDEEVVSEVLRTGYRWKGKVLRPAMVKVKS